MPFVKSSDKSTNVYDTGVQQGQAVPSMIRQGNVDVNHRPSILNADGSRSSIFSMTVPLDKSGAPQSWEAPNAAGYALVPSIVNGKFLSPSGKMPTDDTGIKQLEDAATRYYGKTRQQLGVFSSPAAADEYATLNHEYGNNGTNSKVYAPSPTLYSRAAYIRHNQEAPEPPPLNPEDLMSMSRPLKGK